MPDCLRPPVSGLVSPAKGRAAAVMMVALGRLVGIPLCSSLEEAGEGEVVTIDSESFLFRLAFSPSIGMVGSVFILAFPLPLRGA